MMQKQELQDSFRSFSSFKNIVSSSPKTLFTMMCKLESSEGRTSHPSRVPAFAGRAPTREGGGVNAPGRHFW